MLAFFILQPETSALGKSRAAHGASRCSRCSLAPLFPHSSRSASLATPAMAPHDDVANHPPVPDDVASRPRVLVLGSPSVGKTTLAHRLTGAHPHEYSSTSSNTAAGECFSWQVDTKYYTAAVAVWTARLSSVLPCSTTSPASPLVRGVEALLLVFDLSNPASFAAVQRWAERADLSRFEIRLCVGNKADRVRRGGSAGERSRRGRQRGGGRDGEEQSDFDGAMLLGAGRGDGEEAGEGEGEKAEAGESVDAGEVEREWSSEGAGEGGRGQEGEVRRRQCEEWCADNGIEYVEACAAHEEIDAGEWGVGLSEYVEACAASKAMGAALGTDGEMQGIQRIRTALGAHMWPGLALKAPGGARGAPMQGLSQLMGLAGSHASHTHEGQPDSPHSSSASEESTDTDSDSDPASLDPTHFPYHRLDDAPDPALPHSPPAHPSLVSAPCAASSASNGSVPAGEVGSAAGAGVSGETAGVAGEAAGKDEERKEKEEGSEADEDFGPDRTDSDTREGVHLHPFDHGDADEARADMDGMERLFLQVASVRSSLQNAPDAVRRDTAARLAMQIAQMLGGDDDDARIRRAPHLSPRELTALIANRVLAALHALVPPCPLVPYITSGECGAAADPYVECDPLLVLLDVLLLKPQAHRHVVHNLVLASPTPHARPLCLATALILLCHATLLVFRAAHGITVDPAHLLSLPIIAQGVAVSLLSKLLFLALVFFSLPAARHLLSWLPAIGPPQAASSQKKPHSVPFPVVFYSLLLSSPPECLALPLLIWKYEWGMLFLSVQVLLFVSHIASLQAVSFIPWPAAAASIACGHMAIHAFEARACAMLAQSYWMAGRAGRDKGALRAMMREMAQKTEKRIDSPLVRYNELGQAVCRVCTTVIKSESLWAAHLVSKQHKESAERLKQRAKAAAPPATAGATSAAPRPTAATTPAAPGGGRPAAASAAGALPSDFFDSASAAKRPRH
ncbi:unnamed protein product, partial [Closterium sp. NIES-65]